MILNVSKNCDNKYNGTIIMLAYCRVQCQYICKILFIIQKDHRFHFGWILNEKYL